MREDGRIKDAEDGPYDYARRNDVIEGTEAYWLLNDAFLKTVLSVS